MLFQTLPKYSILDKKLKYQFFSAPFLLTEKL
jgi:hypothetical protein